VGRAGEDAFQAATNLAAAKQLDQQARRARTSTDDAGVELRTFYSDVLPPNLAAASSLIQFWLERTADAAGVQYNASQSDYEELRESRLTRVASKAVLTGQYQNILKFLYAVETAPQFVIIEKVELAQSGTVQQSSGGVLELALDVSSYYINQSAPGVPPAGAASRGGQ
jgi:Tfp pilus assembly protein PilO